MLNHFDIMEASGPGPLTEMAVTQPRLLGNDAHSFDSRAKPIRLSRSGEPSYSCERWLRFRFPPPFGLITDFRIWSPASDLPDGWRVRFGSNTTYQLPTVAQSVYAYAPLPVADPGAAMSNIIGDIAIDEYGMQTSPWLVFQASLTGTDVDVSTQDLTVEIGWTES